jgi:putative transposase
MENIDKRYEPIKEFTIKHRNLPHWQLPGATYFITFRTKNFILSDEDKDLIFEVILNLDRVKYELISFVIMPDHVHLIIKPIQIDNESFYSLSQIMHSIKGFSSKLIVKNSKFELAHIFQKESFDRIIRDEAELYEKMVYIYNNPIKKGLSDDKGLYKWYFINDKW